MLSIILRTTTMFFLVMFALRIMGKKNLGEFQPSDFVSTMLISNLTSIVIEAPELPILYSVVPILLIMCYEIFTSVFTKKNENLAKIAYGSPKIIIKKGIINQQVMKTLRFTVDDLLTAIRSKDIFYLEEVNLAVVETNGSVSVYPDPSATTNIDKADIPPFSIIVDGKTRFNNLSYVHSSEEKVNQILAKENVDIENILLMMIDGNGKYNLTIKEIL
ncbi:MAG: DUF421 domain-containing protein [Oscillospiraceae bacterium]|nr:DUF421 domain-containing protein [Oscillospiraceae bacterium]